MKIHLKISTVLIVLLFTACSTSQESVNNEQGQKEEIYVFDDLASEIPVEVDSVLNNEVSKDSITFVRDDFPVVETELKPEITYSVQVGAFSSKEKADYFVKENQKDIDYKMEVSYSKQVNLFVIWLPKFSSKTEAENVRNILWKKDKYKDAFIISFE